MKIAYIVWRDATHGIEEMQPSDSGLVELHEIGFVAHEDEECITLTMEHQEGAETCRLWLTIPRVNIQKLIVLEPNKFTNEKRRSGRKGNNGMGGRKSTALHPMPARDLSQDDQPIL